ncbi:MAG: ATP-binding protein [Deltaproteobacteria bacterium]
MKPRSPQVWAYVAAPILIGVAVLIRNALLGDTGEPEPDLLLLAVAIAGALGGMGPAVVATAVGLLEEIYFQTEPVRTFLVPRHRDQVELLVFLVSGIAIAVTFEIVRRVRQRERAVRRTLLMVTRCNEAILRATTEEELYAYICKVIVDDGGYRMCWVGLAEHDERKTVRPVAHAGHEDGYLGLVDIVWADEPRGRRTTGTSIREKRMVVGKNFSTDPSMAPWREEAHRRGYRSVTSLPLIVEGTVLGAIVMYSGEVAAFTDDELGYLQRLTDDVAFGVGAIRHRQARDTAVADRERSMDDLRESEGWLRMSQDIARLGNYVFDIASNHWSSSTKLDDIFGIDPDFPRTSADWLRIVHPHDRAAMAIYLEELESVGSRFDHEYRVVDQVTQRVKWVHGLGQLERSADGIPVRLVGTIQDVTDRKVAEEGRLNLQARLAQSARLAAMGTLVAGVAHEVNNPLTALLASAELALEDVRELQENARRSSTTDEDGVIRRSEVVLGVLRDITTSADRISRIVKDLTLLGRPEQRRERVRLADVVEEGLKWLPGQEVHRATIRTEVAHDLHVLASAGQMGQVVVNLVTNALLAIPEGRTGTVVVRAGLGAPGRAFLEVSDDGPGIPPDVLERIFEPFFTTRSPGTGTGLGLPICNAIVTTHGGTFTVESETGKGTTFRVELPVAPVQPAH